MQADGVHGRRPWNQQTPVQLVRPNATYEDSMTASALEATMGEPSESIRARRPPMPIALFPDRYGYRREAFGIRDVVRLDDIFERRDFTQRKSGYGGTSYPSLNQW